MKSIDLKYMKLAWPLFVSLLLAIPLMAETTPLTQPLSEESEKKITCELTQPPLFSDVPVFHSEKEAQNTVGTYHYKLWLPKGYNADLNNDFFP